MRSFFQMIYTDISYWLLIYVSFPTGNHKVHCTENQMTVDVMLPDVQPIETPTQVYLEGMKGYPNPKCEPYVSGNMAQFKLPLQDFFECGVTRVINQLTVCNQNKYFIETIYIIS